MSYEVKWTLKRFETFVAGAMLSEFEIKLMELHIRGYSRNEICQMIEGLTEGTYDKTLALLKAKYDEVQPDYPDVLPVRLKGGNVWKI